VPANTPCPLLTLGVAVTEAATLGRPHSCRGGFSLCLWMYCCACYRYIEKALAAVRPHSSRADTATTREETSNTSHRYMCDLN